MYIFDESNQGTLVGLYSDKYLGCGILRDIDVKKREIEVETPVNERVKRVEFGEIKLENFREVVVRVP